jgi:hypothetical protein
MEKKYQFDNEKESLSEVMGISPERKAEMEERLSATMKEEREDHGQDFEAILNAVDPNVQEAMFIGYNMGRHIEAQSNPIKAIARMMRQ